MVSGTALASGDPFTLVFFWTYAGVGALLALRRPRNTIGWLLIAIAFGLIGLTLTPDVDVAALVQGHATLADRLVTWTKDSSALAAFLGFLSLTVVFPTGRLPGATGRRAAIGLLIVSGADVILTALAPTIRLSASAGTTVPVANPVALMPGLPLWSVLPVGDGGVLVSVVAFGVGAVLMVVRYHRATGVERLQLRWLVAALASVLLGIVTALALFAVLGDMIGGAVWLPVVVTYPTVPLAIGIAVMRYRLYDIDRLISRTIVYAALTAILVATFAVAILLLQALLDPLTGGNSVAVAASTLVVAALFQPLRRRLQSVVDRRFNRSRYDAERTVEAFGAQLRDETDMANIYSDVAQVVAATLQPQAIGVWIRRPETGS